MSADVIVCVRYPPSEGILVLDSWNFPNGNFNEPDENHKDVAINFGQYMRMAELAVGEWNALTY